MNTPKVVITRAWADLAPKLVAFLTGGTAATVILSLASTYLGLDLDPAVTGAIVVALGTVLGYFVRDKAAPSAKVTVQGRHEV
jgi:predicted anti-sigma-YlaC factor YlaD